MFRKIDRRLLIVGATGFALMALVAGFLAGAFADVPLVHAAACKWSNGLCNGGLDPTKTSSLTVNHNTADVNAYPVEPDDGESWSIVAYWNTAIPYPYTCFEHSETATVDVSWNGTAWVLSNESTTTNIIDITVCNPDDYCSSSGTAHEYAYELIVDINDPVTLGLTSYNLRQVVYTTTDMDDGYEIDMPGCTLGDSVSPAADSYSQTDSGAFECSYDCNASGPSVTIQYN